MTNASRVLIVLVAVQLGTWSVQTPAMDPSTLGKKSNNELLSGFDGSAMLRATTRAQGRPCVVADPTGTPLNARDVPDGRVVGTLRNGTAVHIEEVNTDGEGALGLR